MAAASWRRRRDDRGPHRGGDRGPEGADEPMSAAYVVDAIRAPFGRYGGSLASVRPDALGSHVVKPLIDRAPDLDHARIDEVILGDPNHAGEAHRNVARMATLLARLP